MTLARWQATIQDDEGNVISGASVEVRREISGSPLASLFSDRDGLVSIGNPTVSDADGFAAFHVAGGAYRITVTSGTFTRVLRYVAIGLAAESDASVPGFRYNFDNGVNDADPGAGLFRFNNSTPALATKVFISETTADGVNIAAVLALLDAKSRLLFQASDGSALLLAAVSGAVVDDGAYRDVTITVTTATAAGTFVQNAAFGLVILQNGADGDVSSAAGSTTGNLARFSDTSGNAIEDAGVNVTTVGAGKQTIWVPATAMKARTVGPSAGAFSAGSTEFDYFAFDAATIEDATFNVAMPKSWNEGSISYQVYWMHPATTTNFQVVWSMYAQCYSNDEAISGVAYSTIDDKTDTGGTTNDLYISDESNSVSISGVEGDLVNFIIRRLATSGSDTLAVDAYLIGVKVFFTTNANTDA